MIVRPTGAGVPKSRPGVVFCAKLLGPAAVLVLGLLLGSTPGAARPDYTRRTKQECSYCHLPGGWFLNDAGKYFEKHRSLNGYKPPADPPKQTGNQNAKPK
jgi:hypothetical protein